MEVLVVVTEGNDAFGTMHAFVCPAHTPDPALVKLNEFGGEPGPIPVMIV